MRTFFAAALLLLPALAAAQDIAKPLSITIESIGDRDDGSIVARVFFRFANPREVTEAGLFLEGSYKQDGQAPSNFRFAVPRRHDKLVWHNTVARNGKIVRGSSWAALPDQRNQLTAIHTFAAGKAEIEARLVLEGDYGRPTQFFAETTEVFTLVKTNKLLPVDASDDEPEQAFEDSGAVTIREPRRNAASNLVQISVEVLPPVKRVEFWIEDKKVLARNAPPYVADLDAGDGSKPVALRAIGYDATGYYIDADAFVVSKDASPIVVKITRTATSDGLTHFKVSVRSTQQLRNVVLYAGDKKLREWDQPPFAITIPSTSLANVDFVRAVVIDEAGHETSDVLDF